MTNDTPLPQPEFGEPATLEMLLEQASIDSDDQDSATDWFDLHVSDLFWGALEP